MADKPVVVISSTAQDLPSYRAMVIDACHRADMTPRPMEYLPAMSADAVRASLGLVDHADIYVGVFAHRYGYVPDGEGISITQMEYERAVKRGIPRLIFLMHDDVAVLPKDVDKGENAQKLEKLKERLKKEQVVAFFKNPEDLRGLVLHSLETQKRTKAVESDEAGEAAGAKLAAGLHYVSEIPVPPEPYIAHPYTLLQVRRLVGRKEELELLTDWVTGKRGLADVRIFNVVAIGGMGKSALTWTWFNDVAPQEMAPLAGRIWWSFYESDATFENFVTRALAYVSRRSLEEVSKLPFPEQEDLLLRMLDREPFLLVLDGLERILAAYARLDAAYLRDEEALDEETANRVAGALGLPQSAGKSFVGKHRLRMTSDPRAGRFLRELARVNASRILVSSRLYPADLQAPLGDPLPGCSALFVPGLSDQDALALWREYGAKGSREEMLPVFHTFDKHPLLIQLLASEVAEFRKAPGDFDAWKHANLDFNPFGMPIVQVQSHVLLHAIRGLSTAELRTLHVIAGFRMPASMDTIKALLVRTDEEDDAHQKPFATLNELDAALTALEDRGLLGWDRRANRYDLHPIVRGVVWTGLDDATRVDLYSALRAHFEAIPPLSTVETLDDLTPGIELFNILVGLELYDAAFQVFVDWLHHATLYRLGTSRLRTELMKGLFPDGLDQPPRLRSARWQSFTLTAMAQGYHLSGQPSIAISYYRRSDAIDVRADDQHSHSVNLSNLSNSLRFCGYLREAEVSARASLAIDRERTDHAREAVTLGHLGEALATRASDGAATALHRSTRIFQARKSPQQAGVINAVLAQAALWRNDAATARRHANAAMEQASVRLFERDLIRAARVQGTAALYTDDHPEASERLHIALQRARAVSLVEDELPTLIALAELDRQRGNVDQARSRLDDVWEAAERGPYPLFHADALNVLAQIERDAGNSAAAIEAATKAYRLAWCDGPPFVYHWGLEKARAHLAALGAPEPQMPPFDESQHEPMPEVEINPPDEFGNAEALEMRDDPRP